MITPYDLWVGAVVGLIGSAVVTSVCIWLCDAFSPPAEIGASPFFDLGIVLLFSSGALIGFPLWWLGYVLWGILNNGYFWG